MKKLSSVLAVLLLFSICVNVPVLGQEEEEEVEKDLLEAAVFFGGTGDHLWRGGGGKGIHLA